MGGFVMAGDGWVQVTPCGEYPHKGAGVVQVIDREACGRMAAEFSRRKAAEGANFTGVLVDFDHFSLDTDKPSEAAGWITELEARDDGLWARVRWSDSGAEAVEGGRYRLLSPVFRHPAGTEDLGEGRVRPVVLDSVALTNEPNIKGGKPVANRQPAVGGGQSAVAVCRDRETGDGGREAVGNREPGAQVGGKGAVQFMWLLGETESGTHCPLCRSRHGKKKTLLEWLREDPPYCQCKCRLAEVGKDVPEDYVAPPVPEEKGGGRKVKNRIEEVGAKLEELSNRGWTDAARAARKTFHGWGDRSRIAAAAARARKVAGASGSGIGESVLDRARQKVAADFPADAGTGVAGIADAAEYETRKADYERAFRQWWDGVESTAENIAKFHAFVALVGGAAAGMRSGRRGDAHGVDASGHGPTRTSSFAPRGASGRRGYRLNDQSALWPTPAKLKRQGSGERGGRGDTGLRTQDAGAGKTGKGDAAERAELIRRIEEKGGLLRGKNLGKLPVETLRGIEAARPSPAKAAERPPEVVGQERVERQGPGYEARLKIERDALVERIVGINGSGDHARRGLSNLGTNELRAILKNLTGGKARVPRMGFPEGASRPSSGTGVRRDVSGGYAGLSADEARAAFEDYLAEVVPPGHKRVSRYLGENEEMMDWHRRQIYKAKLDGPMYALMVKRAKEGTPERAKARTGLERARGTYRHSMGWIAKLEGDSGHLRRNIEAYLRAAAEGRPGEWFSDDVDIDAALERGRARQAGALGNRGWTDAARAARKTFHGWSDKARQAARAARERRAAEKEKLERMTDSNSKTRHASVERIAAKYRHGSDVALPPADSEGDMIVDDRLQILRGTTPGQAKAILRWHDGGEGDFTERMLEWDAAVRAAALRKRAERLARMTPEEVAMEEAEKDRAAARSVRRKLRKRFEAGGTALMANRWTDAARAARKTFHGWSDASRRAAAAARAQKAAERAAASGASGKEVSAAASGAYESAMSVGGGGSSYGGGSYSSGGGSVLDAARARVAADFPAGSSGGAYISDAVPYEARKADYEKAFRQWWGGVEATAGNIAKFHAFVAAVGGAAAAGMGAYRQAAGREPVEGVSQFMGRAGRYVTGKEPVYDADGRLAGFAAVGGRPYPRGDNLPGAAFRQGPGGRGGGLSRMAGGAAFEVEGKLYDPATGKVVGRVPYSSEGVAPGVGGTPFDMAAAGAEAAVDYDAWKSDPAEQEVYLDWLSDRDADIEAEYAARGLDPNGYPLSEVGSDPVWWMEDMRRQLADRISASQEEEEDRVFALESVERMLGDAYERGQVSREDVGRLKELVDRYDDGRSRAVSEAPPATGWSGVPGGGTGDPRKDGAEAYWRDWRGLSDPREYGYGREGPEAAEFYRGWEEAANEVGDYVRGENQIGLEEMAYPAAAADAAYALGVLQGAYGYTPESVKQIPDALDPAYSEGYEHGRDGHDYGVRAPRDRAAVLRRAEAFLGGEIEDPGADGFTGPDHLSRYNLERYLDSEKWARRGKPGKVTAPLREAIDTRGQFEQMSLLRTADKWFRDAMAAGDVRESDAALAYMADLMAAMSADRSGPERAPAGGEESDGPEIDARVDSFDEDGNPVEEGEPFYEDGFADPGQAMPWEGIDEEFPFARFYRMPNRGGLINRLARGRGRYLANAWNDWHRQRSLMVRQAKARARELMKSERTPDSEKRSPLYESIWRMMRERYLTDYSKIPQTYGEYMWGKTVDMSRERYNQKTPAAIFAEMRTGK